MVFDDGAVRYQTLVCFFPVAVVSAIVVGVGGGRGGAVELEDQRSLGDDSVSYLGTNGGEVAKAFSGAVIMIFRSNTMRTFYHASMLKHTNERKILIFYFQVHNCTIPNTEAFMCKVRRSNTSTFTYRIEYEWRCDILK